MISNTVPSITNQALVPDRLKKKATTSPATATAVTATPKPVVAPTAPIAPVPQVDRNAELDRIKNEALRIKDQIGGLTKAPAPQPTAVKGLLPDVKLPQAPTYAGLVGTLAERAQTPSREVQDAYKAYQNKAENLRKYRQSVSSARADILSAPVLAGISQGREQAMTRAAAEREAALGSELEAASNLYQGTLTGQGQQLSALGTAAGLGAPVQVAPGSTLVTPFEGETVAGGLGGYANYQTAEQVMGLIRQYPDAGYVYDPNRSPQENLQTFQTEALKRSPTYQKETYGQPGAMSVVGGAQLGSAADLTKQASELQSVVNGAEANFSLLVDTARRGGVNDTNVPVLNTLQQNLNRGLTSSAAVAAFRQLLEDVRMQYATVLGGGSVTDSARAQANAQIPDDVSLSTLKTLEQSLKYAAQNRISGIQNQIGSLTNVNSAGNNGESVSVGKYQYQKVNGKWQLVR
jgi:hypothetical protein